MNNDDLSVSKKQKYMCLVIFLGVFIAELIGAYLIIYVRDIQFVDAMSRTANAYYVMYLEPHKLSSMGFVWNPLPSLLQMPILLLKDIFPPVATHGLAGSFVTAVCASINASYVLYKLFSYGNKLGISLLIVTLFSFNPYIFLYGLNGLSEMPYYTTIIIAVGSFANWIDRRRTFDIVIVAIMLALGFLCRYEALAMAFSIGIGILIVSFLMKDPRSSLETKSLKFKFHYSIGTCVIAMLPFFYTILIWIYLNWTIMNDPLYFLNSEYSNNAFTVGNQVGVGDVNDLNDVFYLVKFVLIKSFPFILPLVGLCIVRIIDKRILDLDYWILVIIVSVNILFHAAMLYLGKSYGWLRFFSFSIMITVAWIPYELYKISKGIYGIGICVLLVSMLLSFGVSAKYIGDQNLAPEENTTIYQTDVSDSSNQRQLAQYMNESYPEGKILVESTYGFTFIMNLDDSRRVITNSSDDFFSIIRDPGKYDVEYVVTPSPDIAAANDLINLEYPDIYTDGGEKFSEITNIGNYKVYKVLY